MRRHIVWFIAALAVVVMAAFGASSAFAHQSGCHAAHSCPSDHHTYVWSDAGGQGWDCAEPGAPEFNPALDTTPISQGGLTWYCRLAGSTPPPLPPPPPGSGPSWDPNGTYTTTFEDAFDGTVVDPKWEKGWFGSGITNRVNSDEDDCYDSANVSESGGFLHLLLTAVQNTCSSGTHPYTGALVNTRLSFRQTYGSWEARVCEPDYNADGRVDGWPTWFTNGVDPPSWPAHAEIDIAEGRHGSVTSHLHYLLNGGDANVGYDPPMPYTGCHLFGARWANGTATVYYDSVPVLTHAYTATTPEYIIFNYAVDIEMSGSVIVPGSELTVDWVRAWS